MSDLTQLLHEMLRQRASDLHLTIGIPPQMRVDGKIVASSDPPLSNDDIRGMVFSILTEEQKKKLESDLELDLSFGVKGLSRFRANFSVGLWPWPSEASPFISHPLRNWGYRRL
jgi:twitching motility protein PilT